MASGCCWIYSQRYPGEWLTADRVYLGNEEFSATSKTLIEYFKNNIVFQPQDIDLTEKLQVNILRALHKSSRISVMFFPALKSSNL